jgi:hypothetical protein
MRNIYEEIHYEDGGPNDKGSILGYHYAESAEELYRKFKINHGFIQFHEISFDSYFEKKEKALNHLKIFKLQ